MPPNPAGSPGARQRQAQIASNFSQFTRRYENAIPNPSAIAPNLIPVNHFFPPPPHTQNDPPSSSTCRFCGVAFSSHHEFLSHLCNYHPPTSQIASTPPSALSAPAQGILPPFAQHFSMPFPPPQLPVLPSHNNQNLNRNNNNNNNSNNTAPHGLPPAASPVPHSKSNGPPPNRPSALGCEMCGVWCDTDAQLNVHKSGQKHRKRAEQQAAFESAAATFDANSIRQLPKGWFCSLCSATFHTPNEVLQHLESGKHRKLMSNPSSSPSSPPAHDVAKRARADNDIHLPSRSPVRGPSQQPPPAISALQAASALPPLYAVSGGITTAELDRSGAGYGRDASGGDGNTRGRNRSRIGLATGAHSVSPNIAISGGIHKQSTPLRMPRQAAAAAVASLSDGAVAGLHCSMCNVLCNSPDSFKMHLGSVRHRRKLSIANPDVPPVAQPVDSNSNYECELCGVLICGIVNFEAHMHGKAHRRKLLLKENGNKNATVGKKPNQKNAKQRSSIAERKPSADENMHDVQTDAQQKRTDSGHVGTTDVCARNGRDASPNGADAPTSASGASASSGTQGATSQAWGESLSQPAKRVEKFPAAEETLMEQRCKDVVEADRSRKPGDGTGTPSSRPVSEFKDTRPSTEPVRMSEITTPKAVPVNMGDEEATLSTEPPSKGGETVPAAGTVGMSEKEGKAVSISKDGEKPGTGPVHTGDDVTPTTKPVEKKDTVMAAAEPASSVPSASNVTPAPVSKVTAADGNQPAFRTPEVVGETQAPTGIDSTVSQATKTPSGDTRDTPMTTPTTSKLPLPPPPTPAVNSPDLPPVAMFRSAVPIPSLGASLPFSTLNLSTSRLPPSLEEVTEMLKLKSGKALQAVSGKDPRISSGNCQSGMDMRNDNGGNGSGGGGGSGDKAEA